LKSSFVIGLILLQTWCAEMTGHCVDDSAQFLSVKEILDSCGIPGPCDMARDCEGRIVRVKGHIDYDNIFDKKTYPHLPYEKFTIRDRDGKSIEVWIGSEDSREIFSAIRRHKSLPEKMVHLEGEIVGFDMPIMGECHRGIKIQLAGAGKIFFR
jgi:hypothetical protein